MTNEPTQDQEIKAPELEDDFIVSVNGEDREFTMKFALLRELTRAFPNPNDPQMVFQNEDSFETALAILLVERNEKGRPIVDDNWNLDDYEMAPQDAVNLVKWAMEHVLRFFLTKFTQLPTLGEKSLSQIEALLSSLPGLKASPSTKASAGPMDFSSLISDVSTGKSPTETSEPT